MAQPGNFTPILLYGSSTPTNVPLAANLTNSATGSEIAINVADKNLFFKDSGGTVNTVPIRQSSASSNGWLSSTDWSTFNSKAPATSGTSILYGNGSGGFSNVTIGSGITFAGGTLSATGSGGTVTSVAASVPAFLSISGSPINTSGTLAISYSGTALPVANGGTGATTATGSGSVVLATSPTLTTPIASTTLGVGGATPSASGSGITFPATQSASSDVNTLDDYEEGTWTPVISANGSGSPTFTLVAASGNYIKIGRQVTITCSYQYSSIGTVGGSYAFMTGLPFTVAVDSFVNMTILQSAIDVNQYTALTASTNRIQFAKNNYPGAAGAMLGTDFPAAGTVVFTMIYFA